VTKDAPELPWTCHVRPRTVRTIPADVKVLLEKRDSVENITDGFRSLGLDTYIEFPGSAKATPDFGVRAGPVLTLRYVPRQMRAEDNRLGHDTICKAIQPGDIVVADEHGCRGSIVGGNSAAKLKKAGASALVIDGRARDYGDIHGCGLATIAMEWGLASGRTSIELVGIGEPINFYGVAINPSDVAVVSQWGMAIIPPSLSWDDVTRIGNLK
jgi:hypothetical protein